MGLISTHSHLRGRKRAHTSVERGKNAEGDKCCHSVIYIQRSEEKFVRGWEKYVPALAYLFYLALPRSFLTRFTNFFLHSSRLQLMVTLSLDKNILGRDWLE